MRSSGEAMTGGGSGGMTPVSGLKMQPVHTHVARASNRVMDLECPLTRDMTDFPPETASGQDNYIITRPPGAATQVPFGPFPFFVSGVSGRACATGALPRAVAFGFRAPRMPAEFPSFR